MYSVSALIPHDWCIWTLWALADFSFPNEFWQPAARNKEQYRAIEGMYLAILAVFLALSSYEPLEPRHVKGFLEANSRVPLKGFGVDTRQV